MCLKTFDVQRIVKISDYFCRGKLLIKLKLLYKIPMLYIIDGQGGLENWMHRPTHSLICFFNFSDVVLYNKLIFHK